MIAPVIEASENIVREATASTVDPAMLNRLILESAVEYAILTFDARGRVTSWNEGAERILGWTEAEMIGRSSDAFFTPEDLLKRQPQTEMRIAAETGRAEDMRWHVRKDGTRFWASGLTMPLSTSEDSPHAATETGYVKIFRDQTRAKALDQPLRALEERAALALRSSGTIGVWDYDLIGDVVVADAACAVLYDVDPDVAQRGATAEIFFKGIHPDDREGVRASLRRSMESAQDFDETYRLAKMSRRPNWVQARGVVQVDGSGRPARMPGIVIDVTVQQQELSHQMALLELGDRLRDLDQPATIASTAAELLGETLEASRAGHGDLDEAVEHIDITADWNVADGASLIGRYRYDDFGTFADVLRRGEMVVIEDVRADERVPNSAPIEALGIRSLLNVPLMERDRLKAVLFVNDNQPRAWTDGELRFVRGVFDRTYAAIDRARLAEQRDVMARELAHRMKNMLSIAQSVATQSLRHASSLEEGRQTITARLVALGRAQDILTVARKAGAPIETVVDDALIPHRPDEGRIRMAGPSFMLTAQQVLGLSLALHELGTNASKYGALSNENGTIEITWTVDGDRFAFRWEERGGPAVTPASSEGFGTTILNRLTGQYFSGRSDLDFRPEGLVFTIEGQTAD